MLHRRRQSTEKGWGCIHSNLNTANPVSLYCILATPLPPPPHSICAGLWVTEESGRQTRLLRCALTVVSECECVFCKCESDEFRVCARTLQSLDDGRPQKALQKPPLRQETNMANFSYRFSMYNINGKTSLQYNNRTEMHLLV